MAILLVAAALVPAAAPAAGQVAGLTISIEDDGPFAPGAAITVTISGAAGESFAQVGQCNVAGTACAFSAFVELEEAGSASVVVHIRRYVAGEVGVVDCAALQCELIVTLFNGDAAAVPISVDPTVPIVRPTITVTPATAIADRATVTLTGRGFEAGAFIQITECAWTDDLRCLPGSLGYAQASADGTFSTGVRVARMVAGTDCASRRNLCQLWVAPEGNVDHLVVVGLGFDPKSVLHVPEVSVVPSTGLRHQQSVVVRGADFGTASDVTIDQCVEQPARPADCRYRSSSGRR